MPWFTIGDSDDEEQAYQANVESFEVEVDHSTLHRIQEQVERRNYSFETSSTSNAYTSSNPFNEVKWISRAGFSPKTCIQAGKKANKMPTTTTPEQWFVDEALDQLDNSEVGEAYAGNTYSDYEGMEGVAWRLCEEASNEIGALATEPHVSDPEAFNEVAADWPYEPKCLLAFYEHEHRDGEMRERYASDVESVVENIDIESKMSDGWQTQLDWEFEDNPFADDDLASEEAATVMYVAANGDRIDSSQLDEVDDHEIFRSRYTETENVQVALDISAFDPDIDRSVLSEVAPPSDWSSELDPSDIRSETCAMCGGLLHEVCASPYKVTWIHDRGGHETGAIELDSEETDFYSPEHGNEVMCGDCQQQFASATKPTISLIYSDSDTPATFDVYQSVWKAVNDVVPPELSEKDISILTNLFHRGNVNEDGFHTIMPNSDLGDLDVQRQAIVEMMDDPTPIGGGPAFIHHYDGGNPSVNMRDTDVDTVTEVKRYIVDAVEDYQPQQAVV